MSAERELLKECGLMLDNPFNGTTGINLRDRISELLAQPEQEPVAWMWTRNYEGGGYTNMVFQMQCAAEEYAKDSKNLKCPDLVRPLYTAPPKQSESVVTQDLISDIEYLITAFEQGANADDYWRPISGLRDDLNALKRQKPVAWKVNLIDHFQSLYDTEMLRTEEGEYLILLEDAICAVEEWSPPKQEPMTTQEISQGFRADKDATNAESYWAGVALAEKHYGITGETK
jgi:hypothetical protein